MIRIGARASALAGRQTDEVVRLWRASSPQLEVERKAITTPGDEKPEAPLERMEGTGFFTSSLERALLSREIDVAVHSLKDLPIARTPGIAIAAIPPRGPVEDVLCAAPGMRLADLEPGARVGTSSPRRTAQLRHLRPDLEYRPLRGNVPTRLEQVRRKELDAVVLARAGIERLGLQEHITEVFSVDRVLPAPAQGAIAVQVRGDDLDLFALLVAIDHPPTRWAVEAERVVLHQLRGGCSVPVGAYARVDGGRVLLEAGVFSLRGDRVLRVRAEGWEPAATGKEAAAQLIAQGGHEILLELDRTPRLAFREDE